MARPVRLALTLAEARVTLSALAYWETVIEDEITEGTGRRRELAAVRRAITKLQAVAFAADPGRTE